MSALDYALTIAIEDTVQAEGLRPLGRTLGVSHNTIAAHGSDLSRWSSDELIRLADHSDAVRVALVARLQQAGPTDHNAEQRALICLKDAGRVVQALSEALADSRIDGREAKSALTDVRLLIGDLTILASALTSVIEAGRGR